MALVPSFIQSVTLRVANAVRWAVSSVTLRTLLLFVGASVVACSVFDQLVLDESSIFFGVSTVVVLLLKSVCFCVIAYASNVFVQAEERRLGLMQQPAFVVFRKGSIFLVGSSAVLMMCAGLVRGIERSVFSADSPHIFSYIIIAVCIVFCVQRYIWLEKMLNIRRTKNVRIFRVIAIISFVLMLFVRSIVGNASEETYAPFWGLFVGAISIAFFFAILNVKWTSAFTREEKWKGIGWSLLGLIIQSSIFPFFDKDLNDITLASRPIITGAQELVISSSVLTILFFVRIMFSLVLALPTATVIDRKNAEVRSLSYLTRSIVHVRALPELLARVTELIRSVCGATGMWIELRDEAGVPNVAHSLGLNNDQLQLFRSSMIFQEYIASKDLEPIFINSIREMKDLGSIATFAEYFAKSMIVIPLSVDEVVIGRLVVTHNQEFAFDEDDVSLLIAFTDNISVAIDNAKLFENSLEKERLKQELMVAREMQFKLLPPRVPQFDGCEFYAYCSPALEVGGDYYDFIKLADGSQCVVIGDVSGKGISAAFYMAEVKGIVMALARECSSPKELLVRINAIIKGEMDKRVYITMAALAVSENKTVRYVRAGHTPLAKRQHAISGYYTEYLQPRGLGIGLVKSEHFEKSLEQVEWEYNAEDVYVLFTDGLNEAQNNAKDEFGMERIQHLMNGMYNCNAEEIVGTMLRKVSEFSEGCAQHDDLTLIALVTQGLSPKSV